MAVDFALQLRRQYADSLDADYKLTTEERTAYLTNPLRYAGMPCFDTTEGKPYYLSTGLDAWIPFGSGGAVDWADILNTPTEFTPAAHTHSNYLDKTQDGEFNGHLRIISTRDSGLSIQAMGATGSTGTKNGGWNYIGFIDAEGDRQGYFGINGNGQFQFSPEASDTVRVAGKMQVDNVLNGKLGLQEDGVNLSAKYASTGHTHSNYSLTGHSHTDMVKSVNGVLPDASGNVVIAVSGETSASVDWGTITNKPATFTPSEHSHAVSGVTGLQAALDSKSGTGHTHSQYSLTGHTHNEYASTSHTHSNYSLTGHTHTAEDIEGLYKPADLTYAQVLNLINTSGLTVGHRYKITDFNTKYLMPYTSEYHTGPVEPIIVEAASTSMLVPRVISTVHPTDLIEYDVSVSGTIDGSMVAVDYPYIMDYIANIGYDYIEFTMDIMTGKNIPSLFISWGGFAGTIEFSNDPMLAETDEYKVVGKRFYIKAAAAAGLGTVDEVWGDIWLGNIVPMKGEIIYRKSQTGLETYYDWRNVKFRRYYVTAPLYVSGQTYAVGDLVRNASNEVFRCDKAGAYALTDGVNWIRLHQAGYYSPNPGTHNSVYGTVEPANFKDFYTFHAPDDTTPGVARNISIGKADGLNNIVFELGSTERCEEITIGGSSKDNTISANGHYNEFFNVSLPSYSSNNILIGSFRNVRANIQFANNVSTVDIFEGCTTNQFFGNTILAGLYFKENNINISSGNFFYNDTYNNAIVGVVENTKFDKTLTYSQFNARVTQSHFKNSVDNLIVNSELERIIITKTALRSTVNAPLSHMIIDSLGDLTVLKMLPDRLSIITMGVDDDANLFTSKIPTIIYQ